MLPLIVRPAITTLGHLKPGTPAFNLWVGLLFYIPNLAGGVFGLLGGYFTDRWGRRRILFWSILLYSLSACAASYSTSLTQLLILRSTTIIGISVEFVAAITWLAELFPHAKRRESVLGGTQAFSALGGLMATGAYYLSVTYAESMPAIRGGHEAWRYTLLSGLIPAVPLLLVRPFLPESPLWQEKRSMGGLKRPALSELFQPALRRTTIVTTLLFACSFALAFGALQQTVRMIPGLAEVQKLAPRQIEQAVSGVQLFQELGGLTGRILFAFLIVRIVSQRRRLRLLFVPALFVFSWLYFFAATRSLAFVDIGIFVATMLFNGLTQLLGKLSAQSLSDAFTRYGRELRGEHRRQGNRCFCGTRHNHSVERDAWRWSRRKTRLLRRGSQLNCRACRSGRHFVIAGACREPTSGLRLAPPAPAARPLMKSPGGPMEVDKEPVMRPSSTSAYLLDNARRETSKRFDALSVLYDRDTIRHLENRGVSEGWSCLEVGGGGGSIAAWLAERVGSTGSVLVTDVDPRYLEFLRAQNVEVRRHNIATDPLPERAFDLIHVRLVLMHVREREQALARLVAALKPGGWLVDEEYDSASLLPDPTVNPSEVFLETQRALMRAFRRSRCRKALGTAALWAVASTRPG